MRPSRFLPELACGLALVAATFGALPALAANAVEVSNAEHAQLHSLRGAMPRNEEFSIPHPSGQ